MGSFSIYRENKVGLCSPSWKNRIFQVSARILERELSPNTLIYRVPLEATMYAKKSIYRDMLIVH